MTENSTNLYKRNNKTFFHTVDGWQLVFRATAGIGIPTFAAFIGTSIPPVPTDACRLPYTNSCKTHFRDPLLDKWESQSVKQVVFDCSL